MAVTITVEELRAALRLNDSTEETAEVTRLLAYATEAVVKHAPNASDVVHDEAVRRLVGHLFDQPEASRSDAYANAMRNSGAARILLPYRIHRAGYAGAVEAAQEAVGTTDNPVVDVSVSAGTLSVTYTDGTIETFPVAGGGTTDQTARDAAASAQTAADDAQRAAAAARTASDTHGNSTHNTDQTARDAAATAQTAADGASSAAGTAQAAADGAQTDIDDHEANHPTGGGTTDQTARDAAATAQTTADAAQTDIDDHETNHPTGGGGGDPVAPTPPTVLVEGVAYTAHGDVTIAGWRDYDWFQFLYSSGTTYQTEPVNTVQLIARSPIQTSLGRNVALTLTIDATDDDVITLAFTSGNGVPAPSALQHHDGDRLVRKGVSNASRSPHNRPRANAWRLQPIWRIRRRREGGNPHLGNPARPDAGGHSGGRWSAG